MASYPSIEFPNNIVPQTFNKNAFETRALQSDNILTSSLNVLGPSTLNTLQSNTIINSGALSSNTITSTGALTSGSIANTGALSSGSIANTGDLTSGSITSNTITSTNLLTCNNGLTVTAGTVSFVSGSIAISSVNGCNSRITTCETNITKLQNCTSGIATVPTISANVLTINYSTNNNSPILISPTANFSVVINNIPTTNLNAVYRFELFITGKFYCNALTVNSTSYDFNKCWGIC